jgi:hypothetical protein
MNAVDRITFDPDRWLSAIPAAVASLLNERMGRGRTSAQIDLGRPWG